MGIKKDITGRRFGKLVAVRPTDKRTKDFNVIWELQCDCGNTCEAPTAELLRGRITSCGCGRGQTYVRDLTGQRFGKLEAIRRVGRSDKGSALWECRCDCGNLCTASASALVAGAKQSCGCVSGSKSSRLTGQRFGKLEVLRPVGRRHGYVMWECACACGGCVHATTHQLTSGAVTSCGCDSPDMRVRKRAQRHVPLCGQRFGKLAAVDVRGDDVRCVCDCDRVVFVPLEDLRNGAMHECGQCAK